ncbi:type I-E CRISPR-associated protein Cse2/CasB [Streptomyces sp. RerS4]|uniref:type I-E CRISPR-associated protein Cse2/CasB n=1 Tax=Streptomyces sp. RerS4 TaxID=2942449 RepID=UPI00201CA8B3|nr:type I-E CRISPR-associated protein Cse2/CasB [Streptomyces sp. RerS4]UQW99154.1 type I-E CRISPR-associated protein Cse2/CasB [Streptomyces sp. RerS4]
MTATTAGAEPVPASMGGQVLVPGQRQGDRGARERAFVAWVERLCAEDPGARAALRSGLRKDLDAVVRMHRFVAPWLPQDRTPREVQQAYYAVASMIAAQPRSAASEDGAGPAQGEAGAVAVPVGAEGARGRTGPVWGSSLGAAFAAAAGGREAVMREGTAESRLNLLTRQSLPGLHRHLPASVAYLSSLDVSVDFSQLLSDLAQWQRHSGRIARRWLQDYYRIRARDAHEAAKRADDQGAGEAPASL